MDLKQLYILLKDQIIKENKQFEKKKKKKKKKSYLFYLNIHSFINKDASFFCLNPSFFGSFLFFFVIKVRGVVGKFQKKKKKKKKKKVFLT